MLDSSDRNPLKELIFIHELEGIEGNEATTKQRENNMLLKLVFVMSVWGMKVQTSALRVVK